MPRGKKYKLAGFWNIAAKKVFAVGNTPAEVFDALTDDDHFRLIIQLAWEHDSIRKDRQALSVFNDYYSRKSELTMDELETFNLDTSELYVKCLGVAKDPEEVEKLREKALADGAVEQHCIGLFG